MIEYREQTDFTEAQLETLFLSVGWYSGKFPAKLRQAFPHSSHVLSAWGGDSLVGLIRGLDDSVWQAAIDCLLVHPAYQGRHIASSLLRRLLAIYEGFLYIDVVPDEKRNVGFYQKTRLSHHGGRHALAASR